MNYRNYNLNTYYNIKKALSGIVFIGVWIPSVGYAQTLASGSMVASSKGHMLPFAIGSEGVRHTMRWGIDTAWDWDWWPKRATNHLRESASLGRVTIDPRTSGSNTSLTSDQQAVLDKQLGWLKTSGVKTLYLLASNENGSVWQQSFMTPYIKDISLAVEYLQSKGYTVTAISPFNEPDYSSNHSPSISGIAKVMQQMKQDATLASIDIVGPSTLNTNYANTYWKTIGPYCQIGNTHQLAGTFDNFATFYSTVAADGKKSSGDELHNVNDALVGMYYGMTDGIWWSDFGGYTRAELCRTSNNGAMLAYAENRDAFTSAAVFSVDDAPLHEAFLGTSERQATASAYTFVSQNCLAYYDGYGPYYEYTRATQGGTGYQTGQTNSECVVEITHGQDVPVGPVVGKFKIVNKATGRLLTNYSIGQSPIQADESSQKKQTWDIQPVDKAVAGDFSYVTIRNTSNADYYLDAQKYDADNGAKVLVYNGAGNECERWHLRYMGGGYYTITNHDSGLSLEGSKNNTASNTTGICQWERTGTDRQLWRFVPAEAKVENDAPAAPQDLQAEAHEGSISLSWSKNAESDILGYMIYRYNASLDVWETIGRQVADTVFIDNICPKQQSLRYAIRAVDLAWNLSEMSAQAACEVTKDNALVGAWSLAGNLSDATVNKADATACSITFDNSATYPGAAFDGTESYISLPYLVADHQQLTFSAWVNPSSASTWQRIFDFGRSTTEYFCLTTNNGTGVRMEICHGGEKQGVTATRKLTTGTWTHVAVSIGDDGAKIYLDGKLDASSASVGFRPSDVHPLLSYIGRSMFDADPLYKGDISDIRLYNYQLSDAEVADLYADNQSTGISDLESAPAVSSAAYNLNGQRVASSIYGVNGKPGIYVIQGKKVVIR